MDLNATVELAFPRERVFETYRDRLTELVPYLPAIKAIETRSRRDEGALSTLHNVWQGGMDLPSVARAFIPSQATTWDDHAVWDQERYTCRWKTIPHALKEAVRAEGTNLFTVVSPVVTRVTITGVVEIDIARVPGVPRLLAGTAKRTVEEVIVKNVQGNLLAFGRGVERYLQAAAGATVSGR
ncbi:MAG: hypothetical protein HY909_15520 [Deltaproteobacteria bacterium]|nr:hypothetical protein [Deltaproteobacteria bacterium]